MRPAPIKITLEDQEYTIRPLTLGQLQEIDALLKDNLPEVMKSIQIIRVALSRDHKEVADRILELEIPMRDIGPIVFKLLTIGGMVMETDVGNVSEALQTGTSSTGV